MSEIKSINQLTMRSDLVSIVCRVWRKYYIHGKANPSQLVAICFVLIDAEGSKILASVLQKSEHARFDRDIEPKKIYEFDTFGVSENDVPFAATTHPLKLTFGPQTSYYEEDAEIPHHAYTFMAISDILALPKDKEIEHLIDVIGFVKTMGSLEESKSQSPAKCWLRMLLQDENDEELECVLFGSCASDVVLAQGQLRDTSNVVVFNLARLTWTDDHRRQVASSYGATKVMFNPKLPEVTLLLDSIHDRSTPITTQFSQSMPSQRSRVSNGESLLGETVSTLDKLPSLKLGQEAVVKVVLGKFESRCGWNYDGCAKCSGWPKLSDPGNPNSPLYCGICKKEPSSLAKKMRLTYIVSDESGTASVTFWDKLAPQLVNKSLDELKLTLEEKKRATGVPRELDSQMGKKFLLKLKPNEYNKGHPGSSINVSAFAVCEDLIGQFDAASSEAPPSDISSQSLPNNQEKDVSSHSQAHIGASDPIDLTADQPMTVNLSDDTPLAQVRGKRRNVAALRGQKPADSPTGSTLSAVGSNERLLKNIKKEKI